MVQKLYFQQVMADLNVSFTFRVGVYCYRIISALTLLANILTRRLVLSVF